MSRKIFRSQRELLKTTKKKIGLLCSICKRDAKRKEGRTVEDVGLDIPAYKKEQRIILCEDCRDRINDRYTY